MSIGMRRQYSRKRTTKSIAWATAPSLFDDPQALLHHICALHDLIDGKPIGTYKLAYTAGWAALNEKLQRDENWHEFVSGMFASIRDR
jgi:hypothetical protein